jgi:polyisoprenoid-binding protein YceI
VLGAVCSANAAIGTYDIDPVHSYVGFTVQHYFTKVPGCFTKVKGSIAVNRGHLEKSSVEAVIETASIDTRVKMRDDNLCDQFFAAAQFPVMTFKSNAWKKIGDDTYDVAGNLKIKDVTKEVVLHVKVLVFGPGKDGASISGWEATTTLDRSDFSVSADQSSIANQVNVIINVEADLRKPVEATK